ncbi:hypothetical protein AB0Y04_02000 [Loigolactobacillus coryniformis]|uniref:hypothetical protein n=1 Tax=Loigolactobacillus coryniformis TaxID=1610 RepID=UPI0002E55842|nr:hypothetical protein [Loigolactobacillus coryniformis]ATO54928.1 hypothetical protein LC20001_04515 [Loigolactobacillus coryniformis subsp. coryniformis KCTC 3167 = DSM 20001]MDT3392584.1 hypothetical protein [Bacillota bacterium]
MLRKIMQRNLIGYLLLAVSFFLFGGVFTSKVNAAYYAQKDDTTKTEGPRIFVSPHWVNQVIHNKTAVKDYRIIEASYGNDKNFRKGHIPGATHLNTNAVESEANQWNLLSAQQIKKVLSKTWCN